MIVAAFELTGIAEGTVSALLEGNLWRLDHPARYPMYIDARYAALGHVFVTHVHTEGLVPCRT